MPRHSRMESYPLPIVILWSKPLVGCNFSEKISATGSMPVCGRNSPLDEKARTVPKRRNRSNQLIFNDRFDIGLCGSGGNSGSMLQGRNHRTAGADRCYEFVTLAGIDHGSVTKSKPAQFFEISHGGARFSPHTRTGPWSAKRHPVWRDTGLSARPATCFGSMAGLYAKAPGQDGSVYPP